jgi:hypothetical protein
MPIAPCFDPTTGASGGSSGGGSAAVVTPPSPTSESVASGSNLSAKTFGAFTDSGGVIASYQAVTTNADGTASWSGSGLGAYTPSTSAGDSGTLSLNAKDAAGNVVATAVHTYDRAATSAGSFVVVKDIDLTDVTTAAAISGTVTLGFQSSGDSLSVTRTTTGSGTLATITPTNGQGIVFTNETGNGTASASFLISDLLPSFTRQDVSEHIYAVQMVVTGISYPQSGSTSFQYVVNRGSTTSFSSGGGRGLRYIESSGNEELKLRVNSSLSSAILTQSIATSKVLTFLIFMGDVIQAQQTSGTSLPTPAPGAATTYTVGSGSIGLNDTTPVYQSNGLRVLAGVLQGTQIVTRITIKRFQ